MWTDVNFAPGIVTDDTALSAKNRFIDGNNVRFERDLAETNGGNEAAGSSVLIGLCRGVHAWADNSKNRYAAFLTHRQIAAMDIDGTTYDITPAISRSVLVNPFTTSAGSTTVQVTATAHSLVENQKVSFTNASAVGGITVSGDYYVNASPATNSFTVTASSAATLSASGGGNVQFTKYLAPGMADGLQGFGYGTGGYGTGGYGSPSTDQSLFLRTGSLDNWGQNLIFSPNYGSIYEWAPNLSSSELVANGDFSGGATAWTAGLGWSATASAFASATSNSLTQSGISFPLNAWCLLKYNVTSYTSGSVRPQINGTAIGSEVSSTANAFVTFFTGESSSALSFKGSAATLTLDDVSISVLTIANIISNAPTICNSVFVTLERHLVACGNNRDGIYRALNVAWSDRGNNQTWTPDITTNLANSRNLSSGSRIVRGLRIPTGNLILTDISAVAMRPSSDPTVVYRFDEIGGNCGLIGPNAIGILGSRAYWMSSQYGFFVTDGNSVSPIECEVLSYIKDNFAWSQQDKVYAVVNAIRGEIRWYYPDLRDGNECSRYIGYNVNKGFWFIGIRNVTAGIDKSVFEYPLLADDDGNIIYDEKGNTDISGALTWSLTSGAVKLGQQTRISGIKPDSARLVGGYQITVIGTVRTSRGAITKTIGPFNVTSATSKIPVKMVAEELQFKWSGSQSPMFWRMGQLQIDATPTKRNK